MVTHNVFNLLLELSLVVLKLSYLLQKHGDLLVHLLGIVLLFLELLFELLGQLLCCLFVLLLPLLKLGDLLVPLFSAQRICGGVRRRLHWLSLLFLLSRSGQPDCEPLVLFLRFLQVVLRRGELICLALHLALHR